MFQEMETTNPQGEFDAEDQERHSPGFAGSSIR
jgi:hypothetical protein